MEGNKGSRKTAFAELTRKELLQLRSLRTPERVQRFLDDELAYNKECDGETLRSPRRVLRDRKAHCMEGALLAAAALAVNGERPLVIWLEAVRDDHHIITPFRRFERWGAMAKSNYAGLRFRSPVYRTVRELVISYFEHYYNLRDEKTLRAYSRPTDLTRFYHLRWMTAEHDIWELNQALYHAPRTRLLPPELEHRRQWMDARLSAAGKLGLVE
jgi:hypothetical protein